jgi:hypothetical protein
LPGPLARSGIQRVHEPVPVLSLFGPCSRQNEPSEDHPEANNRRRETGRCGIHKGTKNSVRKYQSGADPRHVSYRHERRVWKVAKAILMSHEDSELLLCKSLTQVLHLRIPIVCAHELNDKPSSTSHPCVCPQAQQFGETNLGKSILDSL